MLVKSPVYRNHLRNIQNEIDVVKLRGLKKLNLFNEKTFYKEFTKDMLNAKKEIIIYSPFVSKFRSEYFNKTLIALRRRNIAVFIFTRPIEEVDYLMRSEVKCALKGYEELGTCVIYLPGLIHQKAAIIDREILWEGSLNILSQRESKEIMRRTADEDVAMQIITYLELKEELAEGYKYQYERLYRRLVANSKSNLGLKIKLVVKSVWSIVKRFLFAAFRIMMLLLRGIRLVANIINCLYRERRFHGQNQKRKF